ncbi:MULTISPECIES: GAP family protein [unclassified Cytobacillus]|uniref:GAP family protein n=1 Tax=unclassified Cytobacillus TaxID=2675268 RepID=UPI00203E6221|nr:GAP family protein [Cytobacillus sp. AMY 15.2]
MPSSSIDLSTTLMYISICAFIDILSPGVLAVTAYMILSQPNQLSSRLLVFLFITQLGYITLGLLLYFGGNSLLKKVEQLSEFDFINWFYILLGAVPAIINFSKPQESTKKCFISIISNNITLKGMIVVGMVVFLIEFVTALPYFYSIFLMNHLDIKTAPSVFIIIGYNLIMILPSLLLLGINCRFKERLQQLLNKIQIQIK